MPDVIESIFPCWNCYVSHLCHLYIQYVYTYLKICGINNIRKKNIYGNTYYYLQESYRDGDAVRTRHIRYLGKSGSLGTTPNPKRLKKDLGTTSDFDALPIKKPRMHESNPQYLEDFKRNVDEDDIIEKNIATASKIDKRDDTTIAKDIYRKAKTTYLTDIKRWRKNRDRTDLLGWDTPHIETFRKTHISIERNARKKLEEAFPNQKIDSRVKTLPSTVGKIKKKNLAKKFTHKDMTDIVGMRVTFTSLHDLEKGKKNLKQKFNIIEEEDYIKKPKSGYRAVHYLIKDGNKVFELQFRTLRQTRWADWMHNTFYKNTRRLRKQLGKKKFEEAYDYAVALSNYYNRLDKNISAERPRKPNIIKYIGNI